MRRKKAATKLVRRIYVLFLTTDSGDSSLPNDTSSFCGEKPASLFLGAANQITSDTIRHYLIVDRIDALIRGRASGPRDGRRRRLAVYSTRGGIVRNRLCVVTKIKQPYRACVQPNSVSAASRG